MKGAFRSTCRGACLFFAWLVVALCSLWAAGALWFDLPAGREIGTTLYVILVAGILILISRTWLKMAAVLGIFAVVLIWWRGLPPEQDREWQPDVDRTAWAEVHGDEIAFYNVRNCFYRTETDFVPRWETRRVRFSDLTGIDLALNYWGSPYMAHPIVSFQFASSPPLCVSIEARKEVGEKYSAIGSLYRRFELIYVVADECDVIRLRSNFRKNEDIYLYRTTLDAVAARERLLEYIKTLNRLYAHPRWYNAVTTNCTTSIRTQRDVTKRVPWDWRLLVNGKGDELLFERGALVTGGLPLAEFKHQARINDTAQSAGANADFSKLIRANRAGF